MSRLHDAWRLLNAPCRDITRLASESLDRDLDRLEWLALRSHRIYCTGCRRYTRQIALIRAAMERMAERVDSDLGLTLPEETRARIKQALKDRASSS